MTLTLLSAWTEARRALEAAGVSTPVLDARALVEEAAGVPRITILTDPYRPLTSDEAARLAVLIQRRAAREPLAYILGRKGFWTLELNVTPAVLTPRPETETVIEAALELAPNDRPLRILDLGVGSGALILTLLAERPDAVGVAVDASAAALAVAQANAEALGLSPRVRFVEGDWGERLDDQFDLIVSNPPYVASGEIDALEPEVSRYEPRLALDGGPDGLDAFRIILPQIAALLAPGGAFVLELGAGQAEAVTHLAKAAGLDPGGVRPDLGGVGRALHGRRPAGQPWT